MPERTLPCAQCGVVITTSHPRKIYCDRKCSAKAMNVKHYQPIVQQPKECPHCGITFKPKRRDRIWCSTECNRASSYAPVSNWHNKVCERCTKPFTAKRSDARFCSPQCAHRVGYEANRAARIRSAAEWVAQNAEARRLALARYKARRRIWEQTPRRYEISARDWNRLMHRHRNACAYCKTVGVPLQVEHVVPLSRGGLHTVGNLLPACARCNGSKGARLLTEWRKVQRLALTV